MESNPKKADADDKKQSSLSSTTATMKIYVDKDIDNNEGHQKEHRRRALKPAHPTVFTDAINNKFETQQQEQQQDPRQMLKKKKNGYGQKKKYKNKNKNKNKNHNRNNNNDGHHPDHRDHHPHQRSNNQGLLPYQEGVAASMPANLYYTTPPCQGFIPGSRGAFHVPHPQQQQQQQHLYANDGNSKVLLGRHSSDGGNVYSNNGNANDTGCYNDWATASSFSPDPLPCSWMDVIDNNSQIDSVVLTVGGRSLIVPLPPTVSTGLVSELLVQKENHKASIHHHQDLNGNANTNAEEGRFDANEMNNQGTTPSSLFGSCPQRPDNHPSCHPHSGIYAPALNPQQPYNGYVSLPPSDNNYGMHMVPLASHYQRMPQQYQNPPMHYHQHGRMTEIAATSGVIPGIIYGYTNPNYFHADQELTGPAPDEVLRGEMFDEDKGRGDEDDRPSSNKKNVEAIPNHDDINQGDVAEGGNHPQAHPRNRNALTPHRGAFGGNGNVDSRRISLSPLALLPQTPSTEGVGNH